MLRIEILRKDTLFILLHMKKNDIYIIHGTRYKELTKELLEAANLAEDIGDRKKKIALKPNLVCAKDPGGYHPRRASGGNYRISTGARLLGHHHHGGFLGGGAHRRLL